MYLHIDFINPQKNVARTEDLDKIRFNIELIAPFKERIKDLKKTKESAFSCMTIVGRWIVIYKTNVLNDHNTTLKFIDFRINVDELNEDFSENTIKGVKQIQTEYNNEFIPSLDNVELTFAETHEEIIKENLFFTDQDVLVVRKAKKLGVLEIIGNLKVEDGLKVAFVDEKESLNDKEIVNRYAFINFGEHHENKKHENGLAYLKIFDFSNNFDIINDFQLAIENLGVKFDRALFVDKFGPEKLN
ncbi:MAG: hypothetical protein IPO63_10180 [Bacteroidetes bacterium]|nr:hypothetical protein [Bacteroidota bacterium]